MIQSDAEAQEEALLIQAMQANREEQDKRLEAKRAKEIQEKLKAEQEETISSGWTFVFFCVLFAVFLYSFAF